MTNTTCRIHFQKGRGRQNLFPNDPYTDFCILFQEKLYCLRRQFLEPSLYMKRQFGQEESVHVILQKFDVGCMEKILGSFYGIVVQFQRNTQIMNVLDIVKYLQFKEMQHLIHKQIHANFNEYDIFVLLRLAYKFGDKKLQQRCYQELINQNFQQFNYNRFQLINSQQNVFQQLVKLHQRLKNQGRIKGLSFQCLRKIIVEFNNNSNLISLNKSNNTPINSRKNVDMLSLLVSPVSTVIIQDLQGQKQSPLPEYYSRIKRCHTYTIQSEQQQQQNQRQETKDQKGRKQKSQLVYSFRHKTQQKKKRKVKKYTNNGSMNNIKSKIQINQEGLLRLNSQILHIKQTQDQADQFDVTDVEEEQNGQDMFQVSLQEIEDSRLKWNNEQQQQEYEYTQKKVLMEQTQFNIKINKIMKKEPINPASNNILGLQQIKKQMSEKSTSPKSDYIDQQKQYLTIPNIINNFASKGSINCYSNNLYSNGNIMSKNSNSTDVSSNVNMNLSTGGKLDEKQMKEQTKSKYIWGNSSEKIMKGQLSQPNTRLIKSQNLSQSFFSTQFQYTNSTQNNYNNN